MQNDPYGEFQLNRLCQLIGLKEFIIQHKCRQAAQCFGKPYRDKLILRTKHCTSVLVMKCVRYQTSSKICGGRLKRKVIININGIGDPRCPSLGCLITHELAHFAGADEADAEACENKCCKGKTTPPTAPKEQGGRCGCS